MPRKGENIYKRKDGRWEGRVKVRKGKYLSVYAKTYNEVRKKVAECRVRSVFNTDEITFEAVSKTWLKYVEKRVKPSSLANYTYLLNRHILTYFGKLKLSEVTRHELTTFIDEKIENGRLKRKGGISKKYLKDMVSIVKSVAAFAEQEFEIQNRIRYAENVKISKNTTKLPDKNVCRTLYDKSKKSHSKYALAVIIAFYTGMRIGEICGLKWEDIDLNSNVIYVKRTVQRIADNKGGTYLHIGTPKTDNSLRIIPIAPELAVMLEKHKCHGNIYVVSNEEAPAEPALLRRQFLLLLRQYGLPHMKFHTLRHIFASSCIEQGFDVAAVSEMLGHSNKSMTLDRYTHSSMETKQRYMKSFKL